MQDERFKLNWIDRLFGKKEQSSVEIGFDELPGWLESRSEKLSEKLGSQAASLYSDIKHALFKIKKSTSLLEEASPEGRYHLKMVKIATSNRDNMVKQVRMFVESITIPKNTDVRTIIDFHESTTRSLTVCLENMMKSYQYTKLVFLEESKQLIADVNALGRLLNQLIEPIMDKKNLLDAFENASKTIQAINDMHSAVEIEKISIKEKEEKVALMEKEVEEKQKVLTRLKDSQAWKQYLHYRDELAVLESNAKEIESGINGLVLPLNKALNRLKQLTESGKYTLQPHVKEGLNLCLSDPKSVNPEFFVEFRNIVESDALNLAQEKRDKMLEQLRVVISSFDSCKKQYQALVRDIEKKKDEISNMNINQEEANLTDRITVLHNELATSEKEFEVAEKHLASLEQNIELKKQELQQIISVIDGRVRISFKLV